MMESHALVSMLFVPASRTDRIVKALGSGAGAVIVDLEDAVAQDQKHTAREALDDFLRNYEGPGLYVRVNGTDSEWFEKDLELCGRHAAVSGIVLPKAESAADVARAFKIGKPVIPLIESAKGLQMLPCIAGAKGVDRLSYGGLDLTQDLGVDVDSAGGQTLLDQSRYQLVVCSRAAGLPAPIETVFPRFDDEQAVTGFARRAADMGFSGMLCIHPKQVPAARQGFAPSEDQVVWARAVLALAETEAAAFSFEGRMVDAPVIDKARALIAAATACETS